MRWCGGEAVFSLEILHAWGFDASGDEAREREAPRAEENIMAAGGWGRDHHGSWRVAQGGPTHPHHEGEHFFLLARWGRDKQWDAFVLSGIHNGLHIRDPHQEKHARRHDTATRHHPPCVASVDAPKISSHPSVLVGRDARHDRVTQGSRLRADVIAHPWCLLPSRRGQWFAHLHHPLVKHAAPAFIIARRARVLPGRLCRQLSACLRHPLVDHPLVGTRYVVVTSVCGKGIVDPSLLRAGPPHSHPSPRLVIVGVHAHARITVMYVATGD